MRKQPQNASPCKDVRRKLKIIRKDCPLKHFAVKRSPWKAVEEQ